MSWNRALHRAKAALAGLDGDDRDVGDLHAAAELVVQIARGVDDGDGLLALDGLLLVTRAALRVEVDEADLAPAALEAPGDLVGERRLADAALLVDQNDCLHVFPFYGCRPISGRPSRISAACRRRARGRRVATGPASADGRALGPCRCHICTQLCGCANAHLHTCADARLLILARRRRYAPYSDALAARYARRVSTLRQHSFRAATVLSATS